MNNYSQYKDCNNIYFQFIILSSALISKAVLNNHLFNNIPALFRLVINFVRPTREKSRLLSDIIIAAIEHSVKAEKCHNQRANVQYLRTKVQLTGRELDRESLRLDHSVDYLALWCGEYTMPI